MDVGEVGIKVLLVELAVRMTLWDFGVIRSHLFVSFPALQCSVTTGRSASAFCNLVAKFIKTPVILEWSCGAVLAGTGRFYPNHCRNQTRARLSARRDNGAATNRGDLTALA